MRQKLTLGILIIFMLAACAGWQTIQARTETMVISYETIGTLAFPTVRAYIAQREENGTLKGPTLLDAKKKYNEAVDKFIQAGNVMKSFITTPKGAPTPNLPFLLRSAALLLADITGGNVQGQTLTLPSIGGPK